MSGLIRLRRALVSVLSLALLMSTIASAKPTPDLQTQQQNPTVTRPLPKAQYIPDHDFDTRHIALDLRFDWNLEELIGSETIVFAPLVTNLRRIELDAA